MSFISRKDVSSILVSEVTRQLARIHSQADGDAAVALLDDEDRSLLISAVSSYSKEKGISIAQIAKDLGVGRTYLYNLLDSNQIELNRLSIIQNYLGVNILPEGTIELFLEQLRKKLYSHSYVENWDSFCINIPVNKDYLIEILLPLIERNANWWKHLESLSKQNNKSILGGETSEESYKLFRIIRFIEDNNFFMESISSEVVIPIDPLCNSWFDLEEELPEVIDSYIDNLVVDYKEDLERETDKQIKKNLQNLISFGHKDLQKILEKSHKDFFKKFHIEYKRIDSARNKILDYCSTNKRLAKKQSYWPLELLDFAENLEENTIPKKEKKAK